MSAAGEQKLKELNNRIAIIIREQLAWERAGTFVSSQNQKRIKQLQTDLERLKAQRDKLRTSSEQKELFI